MSLFLGEHQHSLDAKGRVILPARFREQLAGGAYVTSEIDGCLAVWPHEEFDVKAQEMRERAKGAADDRNVARAFFAGTHSAEPDRQGRIAIPPSLREFAGLERDVVVNGMYDHFEIWDASRWQDKKRAGERELAAGGAS
jgi:MraZ protein